MLIRRVQGYVIVTWVTSANNRSDQWFVLCRWVYWAHHSSTTMTFLKLAVQEACRGIWSTGSQRWGSMLQGIVIRNLIPAAALSAFRLVILIWYILSICWYIRAISSSYCTNDMVNYWYQDFGAQQFVRALPQCQHIFHVRCIDNWLLRHASCPLCRAGVHIDHIHM